MKQIEVTSTENTTYTQTFEVEDDFDPEGEGTAYEGNALLDLIVEEAEWTGPNVEVEVQEREIDGWEWVTA